MTNFVSGKHPNIVHCPRKEIFMRSICGGARYYTGIACRPWKSGIYKVLIIFTDPHCVVKNFTVSIKTILGDPGAASRDDGISWAKVYNKSGRAPGHLLLPNEFQKRLKARLLIGQKNIFLANQRRGTAGRLSCLLTRGCFPHRTP